MFKRLSNFNYSEYKIHALFLWLKFRLKSLIIAKGNVVVTIVTKVVSVLEATNEVTKHVLLLAVEPSTSVAFC